MIEFLFLDLDDTILDFHKAERLAISKTISQMGVEPSEAVLARYHLINKAHWEALERHDMTREQVLVGRFRVLFGELGVQVDAERCAKIYEDNLCQGHWFLPGAQEAVQRLSEKYKLYLASNGTARVQEGRLESADIGKYFQEIFISQAVGFNKPDLGFFETCFSRIPGFRRDRAMIVGDSLTSDIRGGKNAGIRTCWINPQGLKAPHDLEPDYELSALTELEALLEKL